MPLRDPPRGRRRDLLRLRPINIEYGKTGKDPEGKTRRKDRAKRPSGCQGFTN
jgi:hypothetical protein